MDTIIQQIVEKVIKNINKSFEEMINKKATEIIRNVPIITDGRTTGIGKLLRQVKGA